MGEKGEKSLGNALKMKDWTIFKSTGRDEFIRMELKANKWRNVFVKTNANVPVWEVVGNVLKTENGE